MKTALAKPAALMSAQPINLSEMAGALIGGSEPRSLPALIGGPTVTLKGPGIKDEASLALAGLPDGFWAQVQANHEKFQFGVDLIFAAGDRLTALPRSTRVTIKGD